MRMGLKVATSVLLLTGCATPGVRHDTSFTVLPDKKAEVWQKAIDVLQTEGYVPAVVNEGSGLITTQPLSMSGGLMKRYNNVVTVTVSAKGLVRVAVQRTISFYDLASSTWEAPEPAFTQGALDEVMDYEKALLKKIVPEAGASDTAEARPAG